MEYRTFGPTGQRVSAVGQGTWNLERDDRRAAADHAAENAAAAGLHLGEDELRRIDEAFPRGRRRKGVPTL